MIESPKGSKEASAQEKRRLLAALLEKKAAEGERLSPLSAGQRALWFLRQQAPSSAAYHVPFAVRIRAVVDRAALRRAFQALIGRHPCLRTTFGASASGVLLQTARRGGELALREVDAAGDSPSALQDRLTLSWREPFDLTRGPLMRVDLFTLAEADHVLLITLHHIAYDGWSSWILQRELRELYLAFAAGRSPSLPPLAATYADFVARQSAMVAGPEGEAHWAFWKRALEGELPALALPFDRPRPAAPGGRSGVAPVALSPETTLALKALAQSEQATPFAALLAGYQVLLGRLANQRDVLVGSPTAGRERPEDRGVIGYFANPVVLRADLDPALSFRALLRRTRTSVLDALAHQAFPFSTLVERLQPERRGSASPIFQVSMVFQQPTDAGGGMELWAAGEGGSRILWGDAEVEPFPLRDAEGPFDLSLELFEARGRFAGALRYNADLLEADTARRWVSYLRVLLAEAAADPDRRLAELPLEPRAPAPALVPTAQAALPAPSAAKSRWAEGATLASAFAEQAAVNPGSIAVTCEGARLTYAELDARSSALAGLLRERGVGPESRVGLCLSRGLDMVVAILGVLRAGGAYVPFDPASPAERLKGMLEDAELALLLVDAAGAAALPPGATAPTLEADAWRGGPAAAAFECPAGPENAAYVIYTSGSTGKPKGVVVEHRQVMALMRGTERLFDFGPGDVWTLFHSYAFDFSVWELWGALLYGGRLAVVPHDVTRAPDAFARLLAEQGATVLNQTPSAFRALLREGSLAREGGAKRLRWIIFGGEALEPSTLAPWFERHGEQGTRLVNMYGITETTVHVTFREVAEADLAAAGSNVGVALPHLRVHLLDERGEEVPVGVPGEIWVGGEGVARGYLNRPELTAQRFPPDRFAGPPSRLYRSGDLAIRQADGALRYLGRIDHQVKIRGHRVELGEIEALLARHPAVAEVFVTPFDRSEDDRLLVAYAVPKPTAARAPADAERACEEHLSHWRALCDEWYRRPDAEADPTSSAAGWAGGGGAPEAARAWAAQLAAPLLARAPRRVLEIGCGAGLLTERLAPGRERYVAVDFSEAALARAAHRREAEPRLSHVELLHRADLAPEGLEAGGFDLVVIAGAARFLPTAEALERLVAECLRMAAPGGLVAICDVRDARLLEALHAEAVSSHAPPNADPAALRRRARASMAEDEELAVHPALFFGLAEREPRAARAQLRLKRGRCDDERTRFCYDALLFLDGGAEAPTPEAWGAGELGAGLTGLRERLSKEQPAAVALRGLRNARLAKPLAARDRLRGEGAPARATPVAPEIDPEALCELAESLGYDAVLDASEAVDGGLFGAVLVRRGVGQRLPPASRRPPPNGQSTPSGALANDPVRGRLFRGLKAELRRLAQAELPEVMVPSAIELLDQLPITGNGKLDRRALPPPELARDASAELVAPRDLQEEVLAAAFEEVLGVERVGVHDSFFELGGHSLLATQVVSRIQRALSADLSLHDFFAAPTVAGVAARLRRGAAGGPPPLTRDSREGDLPLSYAQERLWILERLEERRIPLYNIPVALRLKGELDAAALGLCLQRIAERHESLRTRFPERDGVPRQVIDPAPLALPEVLDLSGAAADEAGRLSRAKELVGLEALRPFDLSAGPLLRARILRLGPADHILSLTMHHIVADGWSLGVLLRELCAVYNAQRRGEDPALAPLPVQYADYAAWQRRWLSGPALDAEVAHWRERLAGAPEALELPADRPRPPQPSFRGGVVRFSLGAALTAQLKEAARRAGATLYMALAAGFSAYLSRVSGQDDLVLGTPVANRQRLETEGLIGFFVNTLCLRVDLSGDPDFETLIGRVRASALDAYAHQDLPFEKLVEALAPKRRLDRPPLFQAMFVLQNAPFAPPRLRGLESAALALDSVTAKFDLTLSMEDGPDGLEGSLEYAADLFDQERIEAMARHLTSLYGALVEDPGRPVARAPMLAPDERARLAERAQGPRWTPAPGEPLTAHALFEAWAKKAPGAAALFAPEGPISYGELDARASRIAGALKARGVGRGDLVALSAPRSPAAVAAILGVWKAGAAYVPLDPNYPAARLAFMAEDCRARLLLTAEALRPRWEGRFAAIAALEEALAAAPVAAPAQVGPSDLAYVLYTSGSTGQPKGALIDHRGLPNVARVQRDALGVGPGSRVLQFAPLSFDASVWELVGALGNGAALHLEPPEVVLAADALAEVLRRAEISHATLPPSSLRALPEGTYPALRALVSAGEACTAELVERWARGGVRFFNAYGPTEATICATLGECHPGEGAPSIGRPLPNAECRVVDRALELVPDGVSGELLVGGAGLARGYLGRDALTAERFIAHPERPGERLYRTGDRVRLRRDGALEYLGRIDHQLKIRGFRIEPEEVEAALLATGRFEQVAVAEASGALAAYVVPRGGAALDAAALRAELAARLPEHLVPTRFAALAALPLSPSGKVDRKKLPALAPAEPTEAYAAPRDAVEEALAQVFAQVLKRERVGIHDNFFALGGDSILSMQIVARAAQQGLRLRPRQLFQHQTVAALALQVGRGRAAAEQGLVEGEVPLTPIQRWFFEQDRADPHHFNQAVLLEAEGALDAAALLEALAAVERQHDALRLRYRKGAQGWVQAHAAPQGIPLEEVDLTETEAGDAVEAIELHGARTQAGLDLAQGPVARAVLFRLGASSRLLVAAHHLVVDGVSWPILLEDLFTAYGQLATRAPVSLPPKTTSFKAWAERLRAHASSPSVAAELDLWLAQAVEVAPLPLDFPDGSDRVGEAARVVSRIDPEVTRRLLEAAPAALNARPNEILLAAVARALAAQTGRSALRVDLEAHGREPLAEELDLTRTVGWFTALSPVLLRFEPGKGPQEALARVKEAVRRAPQGGLGYGLLRYLGEGAASERLAHLPRPSVAFNFLGQLGGAVAPGIRVLRSGGGPPHAPGAQRPHRLEVNASIADGALQIEWTYGSRVFREETVRAVATAAERCLDELCRSPGKAAVTAADFPAARMSQAQLGKVLAKVRGPRGPGG